MLRFQSPPSSVSQKSQKTNPLQVPQRGPLLRDLPVSRSFFHISLEFLIKVLLIRDMLSLSQRPWERSVPPCSSKRGMYGNRRPFPDPYLIYPSVFPVKEPSLHFPLKELPQTEMLRFQSPHSFISQSPWYTSPLPDSPEVPRWRETPVSRLQAVSFS